MVSINLFSVSGPNLFSLFCMPCNSSKAENFECDNVVTLKTFFSLLPRLVVAARCELQSFVRLVTFSKLFFEKLYYLLLCGHWSLCFINLKVRWWFDRHFFKYLETSKQKFSPGLCRLACAGHRFSTCRGCSQLSVFTCCLRRAERSAGVESLESFPRMHSGLGVCMAF